MAATFETIDADRVAADLLGLERMANRGAFVDHLDAGRLQRRHVLLRAASGGFDRLDAAFPDGRDIFRIGRRRECRKEGQVHAERLVGHVAATRDFPGEQFGGALRQAGDDAKPAGVGDRGGEFGKTDIVHAALNDRMPDLEQFGNGRSHEKSPIPVPNPGAVSNPACIHVSPLWASVIGSVLPLQRIAPQGCEVIFGCHRGRSPPSLARPGGLRSAIPIPRPDPTGNLPFPLLAKRFMVPRASRLQRQNTP